MKMFNRQFKVLVAVLLLISSLMVVPYYAFAGGDSDVVTGLCAIAVGVVFVATGGLAGLASVGATITTGAALTQAGGYTLVGGALIGGGYLKATHQIDDDATYISYDESEKGKVDPSAYYVRLSSDRSTMPMDGASKVTITIQMKNDLGNVLDSLPDGYSLWVKHTNEYAYLVEGKYASTLSAQSSSGIDSSINISNLDSSLIIPGSILTISYNLGEECRSVLLEVMNNAGNVVYSLAESVPNPVKPIPFAWKGITMDGSQLPKGAYTVRLKAIGEGNAVKGSTIRTMYVGEPIGTSGEKQISSYSSGAAYLTLTSPLIEDIASDVITALLKDKNGTVLQAATIQINFTKQGQPVPITPKSLTFSTSLTIEVDGVRVRVEVPGISDATQIIKVTAFEGDSANQIKYEYNVNDQTINMNGSFGSKSYSAACRNDNDKEVYYAILKIIDGLLNAGFAQIGLNYNYDNNILSIDKDKYLSAIQVSSDYGLTTSSDNNTISITASKGTESITGTLDLTAWALTLSEDMAFASKYDLDAINKTLIVTNDPYPSVVATGVKAAGVSDSIKKEVTRILSFASNLVWSARVVRMQYKFISSMANVLKYPMPRPTDPDIDDIEWVDQKDGLIRIKGKADRNDSASMKVYIKTANSTDFVALTDNVTWHDDKSWEVENYSKKLTAGENKINVIIKKTDGREVESGDATVYLGTGGEPDLILVSPRDRQVFENSNFSLPSSVRIKGRTIVGANITFSGILISVGSDGTFNRLVDLTLSEGTNKKTCFVSGSGSYSLTKTIIGAYKFSPDNKSQAYVLRRGDLLFNGSSTSTEGFAPIPLDPDHTGIYTGNVMVTEAGKAPELGVYIPRVVIRSLSMWNNSGFYYATQVPKLISEENRAKVANKIRGKGEENPPPAYEWPFKMSEQYGLPFTLSGKYTPTNNTFYCSELAFWGWAETANQEGFDFGIKKEDLFFPMRYIGDDSHNSILPAYLCEKSMEVRKVNK